MGTKDDNRLEKDIRELLNNGKFEPEIVEKYSERLKDGKLTIQENPQSHCCVYFAAYDPKAKEIFIGHHKKSGLWLFNGGHIDEGEIIRETLEREIGEEWGMEAGDFKINNPELLTITEIDNLEKQTCKRHYDIWHFIPVDKKTFSPDNSKILEEFYEVKWLAPEEAKKVVADPNTIKGIDFIKEKMQRELIIKK
jgi:8-oxo-dGTP pyrophosphatase MutT (NUDIX family)